MRSAMMVLLIAGVLAPTASLAQTESVLWNFPNGANPSGSLLLHPATGTLYGTTGNGGAGDGTVFSLKEKGGTWKLKTIHAFDYSDGADPRAGLLEASAGNFFSTTSTGGPTTNGTVFQLALNGSSWNETVIDDFAGRIPALPGADLIMDGSTGAIFGTASAYGAGGCGSVFEITRPTGTWAINVIYSFGGSADGCSPTTRLREDSKGRLYGATAQGGQYGAGTVFVLTKNDGGVWSESSVYDFNGADGETPTDLDLNLKTGTLYGTTVQGGNNGSGVVFQLRSSNSGWSEKTLHEFGSGSDGQLPYGINFDRASGKLYGTTWSGGEWGDGTVFLMVPDGDQWQYGQLHGFVPGDGSFPAARPIVDPTTGYLYGTTMYGGLHGGGTVWMIKQ